jgi:hypothetical protein
MAYFKVTLKNLFDEDNIRFISAFNVPDVVTPSVFVKALLRRAGTFEATPDVLDDFVPDVSQWCSINIDRWNKIFDTLAVEYNPSTNYWRKGTITNEGKADNTRDLESTTAANVFAYNDNSGDGVPRTKTTSTDGGQTGSTAKNTETFAVEGAYGFQTVQKGIVEELELRKKNYINLIIEEFIQEFCVAVY